MSKEMLLRPIASATRELADISLEYVTDVTVDNRAIGYRATQIGGRNSDFEALAEVIARHDLEMDLAAALQSPELLSLIFDSLFPKKESLRVSAQQGLLTMPMVIEAYRDRLRPTGRDVVQINTLAHILAEITAHSLRHLNVILPFDGVVTLTDHETLFPNLDLIVEAARVQRITTVLEMMKLDPEIGKVKTLSAAALLSALGPMFARAGRLLLTTTQDDLRIRETFSMLRMWLIKDPALPKSLLRNSDLEAMSSNLTYVLAALSTPVEDLSTPPYDMERAIADSLVVLRSLKRFSQKHISEVKQWYVHYVLTDAPGQRITGLVFGRNMVLENRPQVTVFTQVSNSQNPMWAQAPFQFGENRVEPLLTGVFGTALHGQSLAATVAGVATYAEIGQERAHVILTSGATEAELIMYAASISQGLVITLEDGSYGLAFQNEDTELNYDSNSLMMGSRVISLDPAEAIIHTGFRENLGEGSVPSRVQGIPDTARQNLLLTNPDNFTINLGRPMNLAIDVDGVSVSIETSLAELLNMPKQLRLSLTQTLTPRMVVESHFETLLALADRVDITTRFGEIARLRAATALSNFLGKISQAPAGKAILNAVFRKMLFAVSPDDREALRGRLRNASINYQLGILVGAQLLVATGLLDQEEASGALSLIKSTDLDRFMIGSTPHLGDDVL